MAVDTAQKRASATGAGRPFMRGKANDAAGGREWRAATGFTYPVANFQAPGGAVMAATYYRTLLQGDRL